MAEEKITLAVEVIIDNSGSMNAIRGKVVDGVNEFLSNLTMSIFPARVGVTLFDDTLKDVLIDGVTVDREPRLKEDQYDPRWGTENIAHSVIQALDKRLAPINAYQKVLVVITDGLNSSPQMAAAKKLVRQRQSEGWLIIWLGVYMDYGGYGAHCKKTLLDYARDLGIPEGLTFALESKKIDKAMPLAAMATLRFSGSGGDSKFAEFTPEERGVID